MHDQSICSDRHDPSRRAGIFCLVLLAPATVHISKRRFVPFASSCRYISRNRASSSVLAGARLTCRPDRFTFITAIFNGLGTFLKHWSCAMAPRIIREHANGTTWKLASVPRAGWDKQQSSAREVVCHRISPRTSGVMDMRRESYQGLPYTTCGILYVPPVLSRCMRLTGLASALTITFSGPALGRATQAGNLGLR